MLLFTLYASSASEKWLLQYVTGDRTNMPDAEAAKRKATYNANFPVIPGELTGAALAKILEQVGVLPKDEQGEVLPDFAQAIEGAIDDAGPDADLAIVRAHVDFKHLKDHSAEYPQDFNQRLEQANAALPVGERVNDDALKQIEYGALVQTPKTLWFSANSGFDKNDFDVAWDRLVKNIKDEDKENLANLMIYHLSPFIDPQSAIKVLEDIKDWPDAKDSMSQRLNRDALPLPHVVATKLAALSNKAAPPKMTRQDIYEYNPYILYYLSHSYLFDDTADKKALADAFLNDERALATIVQALNDDSQFHIGVSIIEKLGIDYFPLSVRTDIIKHCLTNDYFQQGARWLVQYCRWMNKIDLEECMGRVNFHPENLPLYVFQQVYDQLDPGIKDKFRVIANPTADDQLRLAAVLLDKNLTETALKGNPSTEARIDFIRAMILHNRNAGITEILKDQDIGLYIRTLMRCRANYLEYILAEMIGHLDIDLETLAPLLNKLHDQKKAWLKLLYIDRLWRNPLFNKARFDSAWRLLTNVEKEKIASDMMNGINKFEPQSAITVLEYVKDLPGIKDKIKEILGRNPQLHQSVLRKMKDVSGYDPGLKIWTVNELLEARGPGEFFENYRLSRSYLFDSVADKKALADSFLNNEDAISQYIINFLEFDPKAAWEFIAQQGFDNFVLRNRSEIIQWCSRPEREPLYYNQGFEWLKANSGWLDSYALERYADHIVVGQELSILPDVYDAMYVDKSKFKKADNPTADNLLRNAPFEEDSPQADSKITAALAEIPSKEARIEAIKNILSSYWAASQNWISEILKDQDLTNYPGDLLFKVFERLSERGIYDEKILATFTVAQRVTLINKALANGDNKLIQLTLKDQDLKQYSAELLLKVYSLLLHNIGDNAFAKEIYKNLYFKDKVQMINDDELLDKNTRVIKIKALLSYKEDELNDLDPELLCYLVLAHGHGEGVNQEKLLPFIEKKINVIDQALVIKCIDILLKFPDLKARSLIGNTVLRLANKLVQQPEADYTQLKQALKAIDSDGEYSFYKKKLNAWLK